MFAWLSTLLGVWSLAKTVFSAGLELFGMIKDYFIKRDIEKRDEALDQASAKIDAAEAEPDDTKRIEDKADAVCEIEKIANPDSDCGSST